MAKDEPTPHRPQHGAEALTEAARRRERQAAALRENLRRRKAHERSRREARDKPADDGPAER